MEDHHCIPKEHRNHDLLRNVGFDINCSKNLVIMPNKLGKHAMNLHPKTIVHQGGHHKYNDYVLEKLDEILLYPTIDDQKYQFFQGNIFIDKYKIPETQRLNQLLSIL